ncbi:MAG: pyridoxamine 5'-phosphate oxidase family protein [Candidatus Schekmanbacteria bacterium]|nr:pyridoxamine 5'-phosphate oxidase family protein [Candidatus Schekmanbacteria bacterium]
MSVEMTKAEITKLLNKKREGTLLLVDGERPYGIVCWYIFDGENIRIGIIPQGRKFTCIKRNAHAAFSVWDADENGWCSVFIEGKIRQIRDIKELEESLKLASDKYGVPQAYMDRQIAVTKEHPDKSMSFIIDTETIAGRKAG